MLYESRERGAGLGPYKQHEYPSVSSHLMLHLKSQGLSPLLLGCSNHWLFEYKICSQLYFLVCHSFVPHLFLNRFPYAVRWTVSFLPSPGKYWLKAKVAIKYPTHHFPILELLSFLLKQAFNPHLECLVNAPNKTANTCKKHWVFTMC